MTAVLLGNLALRTVGVSEEGRGMAILLYPVGAATGVYEVGRGRGRHGSFGAAARGAGRGTLLATGGLLLIGYGVGQALNRNDGASGDAALLGGLVIALAAPPYFAAVGYSASDIQPVVLASPNGERTPGLEIRVSF